MTCIVGIETPAGVVMGCDSMTVWGWHSDTVTIPKVHRVGPFIIGASGHLRAAELVFYTLKVMDPPDDENLYPYMVGEFIPAMRACLLEGGYAKKENEVESARESCWLVGIYDKLFSVSSDYCVSRSQRGYDVIGGGAAYAEGALHVLPHIEPISRCEMALRAAAEHNIGVAPPFVVLEP